MDWVPCFGTKPCNTIRDDADESQRCSCADDAVVARCYDAAGFEEQLAAIEVLAIEMMNMKKELRTGSKSWDQRTW